ncbi:MAG TPA: hypothetical protein VFQ39_02735, partial [Longimicrobium sp.]|nr:hypothetical protein [Longimicrobium sp.]
PFSSFDGSGSIATGGASPRYDVALRAHPLDLRDLQGMGLPIPGAGTARFALDIQTRPDGLTRWALTDASLAILDSRAAGRLTALTRPGRETVFTDTRVTLSPLRLTDLEAMGFVEKMPFEGDVSGTIASTDQVGTETGGPLQLDLSARVVPRGTNGPPSSLALRGGVTYVPGSDAGLRFAGLRVVAEPLDLGTLRPLFANGAPAALRGEVRGAATLSGSLQDLRVEGGELAYIVGDAPPTRLGGLTGEVHLGGAAPRWSLRANAEPLALATLTELFPALPFRSATLSGPIQLSGNGSNVDFNVELSGSAGGLTLRGAVAMGEVPSFDVSGRLSAFNVGGIVTSTPDAANGPLSGTLAARGTMKDFRFDVDLTQAGGRFVLGGRVRRPGDDPPQFDVAGRVENFRIGYLLGRPDLLPSPVSGPIRLSGGGRAPYRFDVDLAGEQGRFDLEGWYQPGGAGRFEVAGRIEGVNPQPLLPAGTRLEGGPVAGTISARGTLRDLRFDVDLTQGGGRVVLGGTVVRPEGASPSFDVAGRVENFRIGLLLGRPGLLPNPVTGPIALKGGAGQPYTFDVDLRGRDGRIDLAGWFLPGDVPRYSVSGSVEGLNLSGLPGIPAAIPRTRLTATVAIEGQGTTPETLAGTYRVEVAPGSMIGGVPIERGIARVTARDGILYVDTVSFAARTARFEGGGQLGLTRPAPEPLRFSLQVPDLAQLRQILPGADTLPDLAGSIAASGLFRGTLSRPDIAANGEARGLRWGRWAAADLRFDGSGRKDESGSWIGNARLNGSGIELAFADQRFETLTVELNATPGLVSFGGRARRDAETEIAASGTIELDSTAVRGALLETLSLRIGGTDWQLADRARVAWTPEGGLAVENLLLRRTGGGTGYIAADGVLPPRGVADLRVHVEGVELADVRRLLPTLPDVTGRLMLDAVISGEVNDPRFTVTASVDSLRYGGIATDSLTLTAAYAGERMRVNGG